MCLGKMHIPPKLKMLKIKECMQIYIKRGLFCKLLPPPSSPPPTSYHKVNLQLIGSGGITIGPYIMPLNVFSVDYFPITLSAEGKANNYILLHLNVGESLLKF